MKIIAYYRVSTAKQGASGLGLEAQQQAIRSYADQRSATIVAEFREVETGKRSDPPWQPIRPVAGYSAASGLSAAT